MKGFKKVSSILLLTAFALNIATARYLNHLMPAQLQILKNDHASSKIILIYLGMLGETAPLSEIVERIPGQVFTITCGVTDYSPERLSDLPFLDVLLNGRQEVNVVGISMGAAAAIQMAEVLKCQYPERAVRLYLLDPCVGSDQIGLVKMPGSVMRGLSGAITLASYGLGMLSFIPVARGHSLANIQGEIATSVQKVPVFDEELQSITKVTVSTQDWLVDSDKSSLYFRECLACDSIEASHADFITDRDAWLSILERQGLIA